jgi:hypothetical protein
VRAIGGRKGAAAAVLAGLAIAAWAAPPAGAHHPADNPWVRGMLGQQGAWFSMVAGGMPTGTRPGAGTAAATPKPARCAPGALPETGLQGQVPRADQDSGRAKKGYRCNVRLVGENDIERRGANFQLTWHRDCAYVGLVGTRDSLEPAEPPHDRLEGFAVIDASNPRRPKVVDIVRSEVGRSHHEAIEVNERRGVLVVQIGGLLARWIEVYDVSKDCRKPVFKGRYDAGYPIYHGQKISDDGMTVYATETFGASGAGQVMHVIDISDLTTPRLLALWDPQQELPPGRYGIHDLELSPDGTRAYLGAGPPSALPGVFGLRGPEREEGPSLVVLDTTEVQQRKPNPDLKVISEIELTNFGHAIQRARIGGRPYLFSSGETPFVGARNCPWSWGHVVDMGGEAQPKEVAEIKLEVNEQKNCDAVGEDDAGYSIHYVGVDDERNTTKVFYTYYSGGLRVFDVRDPRKPREIAYYHPPPKESVVLSATPGDQGGDLQTPTWDSATSVVRYRPETGHVWFASIGGGLQVVELTGDAGLPRGSARIVGRARRTGRVRVRARCTAACSMRLELRVAGRRAARRTVRFAGAGRRTVSLLPNARARARLISGRARVRVRGAVRDRASGRVVHRFRSRARTLGGRR